MTNNHPKDPPKSQEPHHPDPAANKPQAERSVAGGPLDPPLPQAQSAPDRQPPPAPNPWPDDAPRDSRLRDGGTIPNLDRSELTPEQRTGVVTEPHIPQKFRRPLAQPGDNDYVAGQPVNEEEAQRMEALEQERYDYAIQAGKDAEERRHELNPDAPEYRPGEPKKAPEDHDNPDGNAKKGKHK